MQRSIVQTLISWKQRSSRMPLMLRGARQIGKSYIAEWFGRTHFQECVTINFENDTRYKEAFSSNDPVVILRELRVLSNAKIMPGESLLFLDEIQACPRAIEALRYFKEQMPELHVISAGSLLEFVLNDANFHMPVGRVEFLFMQPLSFVEFLMAGNEDHLLEFLKTVTVKEGVSDAVHAKCMEQLALYSSLGGMPAVVDSYYKEGDLLRAREIQLSILNTYRNDFGKYASLANQKHCEKIFVKAPGAIARNFRYRDIDPDVQSRELKVALELLLKAGVINKVTQVHNIALPLVINANEKKFKLLFLDMGLAAASMRIDIAHFIKGASQLINAGQLQEQLVGQLLQTLQNNYQPPELYFWERDKVGSQAEVDYLYQFSDIVFGLEVKSGASGRLRSLKQFNETYEVDFGIKVSTDTLHFDGQILSIPIYLLSELDRLIAEVI